MSARSASGKRKEEAEHRAKVRQMFDEEITHIRCGDWRGTKGAQVVFLGTVAQLHGTVCTCCRGSANYQEKEAS